MAQFAWDKRRVRAAEMVAEGRWSDPQVAAEVGVSKDTIFNWRQRAEFQARVRSNIEAFAQASLDLAVAQKARRVASINRQWLRLHEVIDARAADPTMAGVPGGSTGLIIRDVKAIGRGQDFRVVEVYTVDTGTLKSLLDHARQAAQELGQWIEKGEYDLSDADLISRTEATAAADAPARPTASRRPDPRG